MQFLSKFYSFKENFINWGKQIKLSEEFITYFCKNFVKNSVKLQKLLKKFLKNEYGMFGKILFTKFSSKIVLKIFSVHVEEQNWRKFWRYFGKVLAEFPEKFEKIFLRLCEKFTKMWRLEEIFLEDTLQIDTEQNCRKIFKIFSIWGIRKICHLKFKIFRKTKRMRTAIKLYFCRSKELIAPRSIPRKIQFSLTFIYFFLSVNYD